MNEPRQRFVTRVDRHVKQHPRSVPVVAALLFGFVGYVDYVTGTEISISIFYLIPVSFVAWYAGLRAGLLASVVGGVVWYLFDSPVGGHHYANPAAPYWNSAVRFGFFTLMTLTLSALRRSLETIRSHAEELRLAYVELDRTRQEQLGVKDQLLSHVSHELRTPLTATHQFVTILLDGLAGELRPCLLYTSPSPRDS